MTTSSQQAVSSISSSDIDDLSTYSINIAGPSYVGIGGAGGAGGAGSTIAWNGAGSIGYSNPPTISKFHNSKGTEVFSLPAEEPTLDVKGRIRINGEYLDERLDRIETLLHIPTRDVIIEEQYPKLKALFEEYMKELEKYKTWNRLTTGKER